MDCSPGFPSGSVVKNMAASVGGSGDVSLISRWEDPLEKEMATHSSTLAWRIPCTEEPGRLESTGLWRVGHNRVTFTVPFIYEKKVQVPIPLVRTEDSPSTFPLPKGFCKVHIFGLRRFLLYSSCNWVLTSSPSCPRKIGISLMSRMVVTFPFLGNPSV